MFGLAQAKKSSPNLGNTSKSFTTLKFIMFTFSPGTNPGTKKSQELAQELKPKSSSSGTKLRTKLEWVTISIEIKLFCPEIKF